MEPLKPYVWLDESPNPDTIKVKMYCIANSQNYIVDEVDCNNQGDAFLIKIKLKVSDDIMPSGFPEITKTLQLDSTINYTNNEKIVVKTLLGSIVKGTTTVFLKNNNFTSNNLQVFCWLKFHNSTKLESFIKVNGLSSNKLKFDGYTQHLPSRKFILNYSNAGINTTNEDNRVIDNTTSPPYDTSLHDSIVVNVTSGTNHGTGTTTDSEADSSGDDLF